MFCNTNKGGVSWNPPFFYYCYSVFFRFNLSKILQFCISDKFSSTTNESICSRAFKKSLSYSSNSPARRVENIPENESLLFCILYFPPKRFTPELPFISPSALKQINGIPHAEFLFGFFTLSCPIRYSTCQVPTIFDLEVFLLSTGISLEHPPMHAIRTKLKCISINFFIFFYIGKNCICQKNPRLNGDSIYFLDEVNNLLSRPMNAFYKHTFYVGGL